jgi:two-component system NarL family sensor kinase
MSGKILLSAILLCTYFFCYAQTEEELIVQLEQETDDSLKFYIYRDLGYIYEFGDSAKAMDYYRKGFDIAKRKNSPYLLSMTWLDFGSVQFNSKQFEKAVVYYKKSLEYAQKSGNYKRMGVANVNIGNAKYYLNEIDSAASYALNAIRAQEMASDTLNMAITYSTLSIFYEDHDRLEESLKYAEECKKLSLAIDFHRGYSGACLTAGVVYLKLGNKEAMEKEIQKALLKFDKIDHPYYKASYFQNISGLYYDTEQYELANRYADSSLVYFENQDESYMTASVWMSKGLALIKLGKGKEGMTYLNKALPLALETKDWQVVREIYLDLSDIEAQQGNWNKAFEYSRLYGQYKDSTHLDDIAKNAAELSARFNAEKQQIELERLARENELKAYESVQQRRRWWVTLFIAVLALVILLLMYIIQRRKTVISKQQEAIQREQIKLFETERQVVVLDSMLKGEENERSRVAKDLHDGVGSLLSGVKLSLASMQGNMIIREDQARIYERSLQQLDDAIAEMRRVAHNMMPEVLLNSGLIQATTNLTHSIAESSGIEIHFEHHDFKSRLPSDYEIILYRLIQELLNNVIKHAEASKIIVQLSLFEDIVNLVVEDNGKGFDSKLWENSTGMGFHNLKNRVNYFKGKIDVKSSPDEGTSFLIEFKLPEEH